VKVDENEGQGRERTKRSEDDRVEEKPSARADGLEEVDNWKEEEGIISDKSSSLRLEQREKGRERRTGA
jgi:hypothetical protein